MWHYRESFIATYVAPTCDGMLLPDVYVRQRFAYWIGWSIISWRAKRTGGAP